jgi:hypothetical protein
VETALTTTPSAAHETERCLSPYPQDTEHAPHSDDLYSSRWHVPRPHRMSSGGGGSWLQFEAGASAPVPCTWHLSTRDWEPMPHVTEQAPHGVLAFHSYETGARVAMGDGVEPEPANVALANRAGADGMKKLAGAECSAVPCRARLCRPIGEPDAVRADHSFTGGSGMGGGGGWGRRTAGGSLLRVSGGNVVPAAIAELQPAAHSP